MVDPGSMLNLLATTPPPDRSALNEALAAHLRAVSTPAPRGNRGLVAQIEAEVSAAPEARIRFDGAGFATLDAAGRTFEAGRFETPRLGMLRERAEAAKSGGAGQLRLFVLTGRSPATDIGSLQAWAPPGSLFQVASQFNCLEAPDACIVPIADYFFDPTQGPRASISAVPGTFVRHYAAPRGDGSRFVQVSDASQIDLLEELCSDGSARVTNGYLLTDHLKQRTAFARALEERFEDIRIGLHDGVEVVFGHDWDGPVPGAPTVTVAQAFCSTVAGGGYSRIDPREPAMQTILRQLQRAAYLGTLTAAAALGKSHAVLTLIGGGAFGNPVEIIWEAILWATDAVRPLLHRDLCVVVNGFNLGDTLPRERLVRAATDRAGALVEFTPTTVSVAVS
jgi:hypothetical protein